MAHIMLGINDAGGVGGATYESYVAYYELLIRQYIEWGCGVVLHTTTPSTFNATNTSHQRWSKVVHRLAVKYGCPVFESENTIKYATFDGIYSDGTHFNSHGYYKYARSVCSFILYGAWVRPVKGVVGQTIINSGELNNNGFIVNGSGGLSTSETNSYLETWQVAQLNTSRKFSFSFYMEEERMDLKIVGLLDSVTVDVYPLLEAQYEGDDRGEKSTNKLSVRSEMSKNVAETTSYTVMSGKLTSSGKPSKVANLYGKGWKTITLSLNEDVNARYMPLLILTPRGVFDLSETVDSNGGVMNEGKHSSVVYQIPYVGIGEDSTLPSSTALPSTFEIPCPKGLLGCKNASANFYDSLPVNVSIYSTVSDYWVTFTLSRTDGTNVLNISNVTRGENATESDLIIGDAKVVVKEWDTSTVSHNDVIIDSDDGSANATIWLQLSFTYSISSYYNIVVSGVEKTDGKTWM